MHELIKNLHFADLLDIAIVAFVIYRLVSLLKETIALRILFGLLILFLLHFASQFAALPALQWITGSFISYLVILLVVVFHSDIRRALLIFGGRRAAPEVRGEEVPEAVAQVVAAAGLLSERRIGALIVLQRLMELDNFIEVGTSIDARVTSELLTSIFLPYSPIHDGAVIIRDGKLTMAGCFLPLSRNPSIDKSVGTRHRAALGLTEMVDAVVVVVSEETGNISVVTGGRITVVSDAVKLGKLLRRLMEPDPATEGGGNV